MGAGGGRFFQQDKAAAAACGEGKGIMALAALCTPVASSKASAAKAKGGDDTAWMRGLGAVSRGAALAGGGGGERSALKGIAKDALVTADSSLRAQNAGVGSLAAATGVAASAGGGVPAERIVDTGDGKLTVTETRDFAGQALTVTRTLDATSKEAKKLARKAGEAKTGGIDAVLMQLEKRRKLNILDKTKVDWGNYKQEQDLEVVEDLEKHKTSGKTHLEQKDFLERTDLKQYEIERDQRLAASARAAGKITNR